MTEKQPPNKESKHPDMIGDWENMVSPNPLYQGMTIKEATRYLLLNGGKRKRVEAPSKPHPKPDKFQKES